MAKKNNLKQQRDNRMKQFILTFIDSFSKVNGREPIESEIVDNLKDQLDTDKIKDILVKIRNEGQGQQQQQQQQQPVTDSIAEIV
jgi:flagellar basal body-associated protein FliL